MLTLSSFRRLHINGISMTRLTLDGKIIWQRPITNRIPLSINTDGSIYNGGMGYRRGYRIRSGGTEASTVFTSCSGFIPVKPGDVIRITNCQFSDESNSNAINVADAGFNNIGQWTMLPAQYGIFASGYTAYSYNSVVEEKPGVWKWVAPPAAAGVAYIRLSCYDATVSGGPKDMVLTINEEIV